MTSKADFNGAEWEQVASLPGLVIVAAALSDGKIMPSVREVTAGGEALTRAPAAHPDVTLLADLVGASTSKLDLGGEKPPSAEAAVQLLETQITAAWATLSARATGEELAAVRQTLTEVARAVVERIGTGFMGSGEKVSPSEQVFVDALTGILA